MSEARLDTQNGTIVEYRSLLGDAAAPDPRFQASLEALRTHLIDATDGPREHERLVATLYCYEGLTLKEIGQATNLTECRVSQLLKRALGKLHERQVLPLSPAVAIDKRAWAKGRFAPVRGKWQVFE